MHSDQARPGQKTMQRDRGGIYLRSGVAYNWSHFVLTQLYYNHPQPASSLSIVLAERFMWPISLVMEMYANQVFFQRSNWMHRQIIIEWRWLVVHCNLTGSVSGDRTTALPLSMRWHYFCEHNPDTSQNRHHFHRDQWLSDWWWRVGNLIGDQLSSEMSGGRY